LPKVIFENIVDTQPNIDGVKLRVQFF
jgi:hypothetical protein